MKIVLLESLGISDEILSGYAKILESQGHIFKFYLKDTNPKIQIEYAKDADVIMVANMPLTGEVIRACQQLKFINVAFTGVDHIDLEAAKEKHIAVSNASGYSNEAVAELVIGMIISLLRNIPQVQKQCRNGKTKDGFVGRELAGKTVGIIGTGKIGLRTAQLCYAFGCNILGFNPRPKENPPEYIHYVSLEELLKESDIVSLHCPLTEETRGLINKKNIQCMKQNAILINAARGAVVDSEALSEALNNKRLGGAGIDVFETEPPIDQAHPLLHTENTIVTPHIAFASEESMKLRAKIVFDNLQKWIDGKQENIIL